MGKGDGGSIPIFHMLPKKYGGGGNSMVIQVSLCKFRKNVYWNKKWGGGGGWPLITVSSCVTYQYWSMYFLFFSEVGIDGLEFTKAWLKRSHDKITDVNAVEEAMALPLATPAAIMNEAYIELLDFEEKNVIPEVKW